MKRLIKHKQGQFVIIAVLLIAIMIISIGALMHRAVTYYKHEPWEEYLTLIGNIELNSRRLVELSLANYTQSLNQTVLKNNLENWQIDLLRTYAGREIALNYDLTNRSYNVYGANVNYYMGLNHSWEKQESFSAANATFAIDITSIGLTGYSFTATSFLRLKILGPPVDKEVKVTVTREDGTPIINLKKENFRVANANITSVTSSYLNQTYPIVYTIKCDQNIPTPVTIIKVWDSRGIQVTAKYP